MNAFWTSMSGMKAGQAWLDRVGDNMANVGTVGFAQSTGSFADALTAAWGANATGPTQAGRLTPPGWNGGSGVISTGSERDFTTMPLQTTGVETDLAVDGPGFFLVQGQAGAAGVAGAGAGVTGAAGQPLLTKAGDFTWSKQANGQFVLSTNSGQAVLDTNGQPIRALPNGKTSPLSIQADGAVSIAGKLTGQRIAIAEVGLPSSELQASSNNTFALVPGGNMTIVNRGGSGSAGAGSGSSIMRQGVLSDSNVDMTKTMIDMVQAQSMFQLNAEAEQIDNKMATIANNIHS